MFRKNRNFSYYESLQIFFNDKIKLFLVISVIFTFIVIYPFLVPHLGHPSMAYHIIIHIISLDIALFLIVVSTISYKKTKSNRVLFTAFSFATLFIVEAIYLLQASGNMRIFYVPLVEIEFSHVMLSVMLVLFVTGVLKVEKK